MLNSRSSYYFKIIIIIILLTYGIILHFQMIVIISPWPCIGIEVLYLLLKNKYIYASMCWEAKIEATCSHGIIDTLL